MNDHSMNEINNESDLVDDFIFSESDTIGTVIHSEYRQDQKIYYESLKKVFEARDKGPSQRQETNQIFRNDIGIGLNVFMNQKQQDDGQGQRKQQ